MLQQLEDSVNALNAIKKVYFIGFSHGEYSDYSFNGMYASAVPIDKSVYDEFVKAWNEEERRQRMMIPHKIITWKDQLTGEIKHHSRVDTNRQEWRDFCAWRTARGGVDAAFIHKFGLMEVPFEEFWS